LRSVDGFLLLKKPAELTSFQALGPIKKILPGTKVGHTGTLDRFAEGLLLVVCGRMTRLTPVLTGLDKEYVADVRFGKETTTLDPEGDTVAEGPVPDLETIERAVEGFVGSIEQVPPQYSAIHVGGVRAYRSARRGETVTIAPRPVTIRRIEIEGFEDATARLRVECSSGTYIRALARDLGRSCGSYASLTKLVRTRVGAFELAEAVAPEDFRPERDLYDWHSCFSRLPEVQELRISAGREATVRRGGRIDERDFLAPPADGRVAVYDEQGQFLALVLKQEGKYRYEMVAAPPGH